MRGRDFHQFFGGRSAAASRQLHNLRVPADRLRNDGDAFRIGWRHFGDCEAQCDRKVCSRRHARQHDRRVAAGAAGERRNFFFLLARETRHIGSDSERRQWRENWSVNGKRRCRFLQPSASRLFTLKKRATRARANFALVQLARI